MIFKNRATGGLILPVDLLGVWLEGFVFFLWSSMVFAWYAVILLIPQSQLMKLFRKVYVMANLIFQLTTLSKEYLSNQ